ncbi:ABC transporter substrate-binding protein [Peribacillus frigoritolerans]|uniref:ABC transporter substrate-binding protein n=1 Tax=Peribacillus frigoritolerans TaxID=450367 RepID=UPI0038071220
MKQISILSIIILMIIPTLTGCDLSFSNKNNVNMLVLFKSDIEKYEDFNEKLKSDKKINLDFDYLIDDDEYYTGDLWSAIEIGLNEKLKNEDIDIIANIPTPYLYEPIKNKQLESFEKYLDKDKFNISNIYQPIVDISKKAGNGEIFFLSPSFNNKMLVINNDIFNKLKINVPTNTLTWSEVYDLSLLINKKGKDFEDIYPISLGPGGKSGLFMDFELLTSVRELSLLDNSSNIYPNKEWITLIDQFVKLFKTNGESNKLDSIDDMFFQGKVGMKILYPKDLNVLYNKYSTQELGFKLANFEYTVLPAPEFDDKKNITYIDMKNLAISKNSKKKDLAWKTIKYAMSKDYASFMANSERNAFMGKFTSYKDDEILKIYSKKYEGINPEFFYSGTEGPTKPEDFTEEKYVYYHKLARKYFPDMIENKLTVEKGIEKIRNDFKKKTEGN